MTDPVHIRILRRADAVIFQAHRLEALLECPEAFGSTFQEDSLLSLDVVAGRLEAGTEGTPRRDSSVSAASSTAFARMA